MSNIPDLLAKRDALLALAEAVSRQLHCTNICAFSGNESDTGTFVVFADGIPRFRCDRSLTCGGQLRTFCFFSRQIRLSW